MKMEPLKVFGDTLRTRCPVCHAPDVEPCWRIPFGKVDPPLVVRGASTEHFPTLDLRATVYSYARCGACGSVFLSPFSTAEKAVYRDSTFHVRKYEARTEWEGYKRQYRLQVAPHVRPTDRVLLDAACGAGHYLEFAVEDGHQWARRIGIELSTHSVAHMVARGLAAHVADLDVPQALDALVPPGTVDVMIFSEAFEHVEEPAVAMATIRRTLAQGGRVFFTAQAIDGGLPVRPGEPIYASRAGLDHLLAELGLTPVTQTLEAGRWKIICAA